MGHGAIPGYHFEDHSCDKKEEWMCLILGWSMTMIYRLLSSESHAGRVQVDLRGRIMNPVLWCACMMLHNILDQDLRTPSGLSTQHSVDDTIQPRRVPGKNQKQSRDRQTRRHCVSQRAFLSGHSTTRILPSVYGPTRSPHAVENPPASWSDGLIRRADNSNGSISIGRFRRYEQEMSVRMSPRGRIIGPGQEVGRGSNT
jgi:hypothetical protein